MADTSTRTPGITCPHDRIAILEDLVEFHSQRSIESAHLLLRIAADLDNEGLETLSIKELRAIIGLAGRNLKQAAHELARGNLNTESTLEALKRWPFMVQQSRMLS
ncbi:hypothetical protein [Paraburkholderia adhaesiva]|uniref:hypothetical protein n=1 Tax=Paraburkholderia adhaesiva TaxID=2883244 RepID=UPI001F258428|nr:hypothetical protein [Paraburkholderia adhaesiva]